MLAASIDGFFSFLAACYELTLILCFSCLRLLLFVANKFLLLHLLLGYILMLPVKPKFHLARHVKSSDVTDY